MNAYLKLRKQRILCHHCNSTFTLKTTNLRITKSYTQFQLANKLGISENDVVAWENGAQLPNIRVFHLLARLFGLTMEEIMRIIDRKTRIIMLIDKSQSMNKYRLELVDAYNSLLNKQKRLDDEAIMSVFLFDSDVKVVQKSTNVKNIDYLKKEDYKPSGLTALYDAIGLTINHYYKKQEPNEKVIMVIHTDGFENDSKKYTKDCIANTIKGLKEKNCEFIIIGSNFDVDKFGEEINIGKNRSVRYVQEDIDSIKKQVKKT